MKPGRPSKPANQRVTRHKPTHELITLPAEGRQGRVPAPMGGALNAEAGKLWRRLWKTPEATQWGEADVPGLTRYAVLAVNRESWLDSKMLGELRNLEDRYGLNSYSRRVAKWVHEDAPETQDASETTATVRRLKAVDADAVERSG